MLDENVPAAVARMLTAKGHQAEFIKDYVPPGSVDPVVATVSEELDAVLLSFDGDFERIAPRVPDGQKRRFRKLSRVWLRCNEPQAATRLEAVLDFIEAEFNVARASADSRMVLWIGSNYLRTNR